MSLSKIPVPFVLALGTTALGTTLADPAAIPNPSISLDHLGDSITPGIDR
jgi:hypothetical protein